ncbi:MAG TPA: hypothetical protein VLT89_09030, partial [Usitatibacter sp.]|nr:hypothetical protein [Usitatibacter sp.]
MEEHRDAILAGGSRFLQVAAKLKAEAKALNVGENNPSELPRLLITRSDLVVAIGLSRIDITLRPAEHVAHSFGAALEYFEATISPVLPDLIGSNWKHLWSGLIAECEFPGPEPMVLGVERAAPVFDTLLKIDRKGRKLSS